jgi:beta-lactamase class D OXA-2
MHRNLYRPTSLFGLLFAALSCVAQANTAVEVADWGEFFSQYKAEGTIVICDERRASKGYMAFNTERAGKRYSPASTFKIPHALFALDSGVVRDEFEKITWDGTKRSIPSWNQDQDLRSSMRHSVVWVYEGFAEKIGEQKEREYLERAQYGNEDPTGKSPFWVEGNLQISAHEQIGFLRKLYQNELPFRVADQRLVKDLILIEAGRDWILRGKTGWSGTIGWWVGWVEHATGPVFFALNIDTPGRMEDLPKREGITRAILESLGALKPDAERGGGRQSASRPESK